MGRRIQNAVDAVVRGPACPPRGRATLKSITTGDPLRSSLLEARRGLYGPVGLPTPARESGLDH